MKEVLINGVAYLPANQLAKEFRYTSDYIGQLCRAKKVDAQLIGRSWYVNPESLRSVRQKRYSRQPKSVIVKDSSLEAKEIEVVKVESPLAKATVKMHKLPQSNNFAKHIEWKPVRYEDDEAPLLPSINKEVRPINLKVNLADSSDISIKTTAKSTILLPDELPTVSLKGRVKITSLEDLYDVLAEDEPGYINNSLQIPTEQSNDGFIPQVEQESVTFANKIIKSKRAESERSSVLLRREAKMVSVPVLGLNRIEWSMVVVNFTLAVVLLFVVFGQLSFEASKDNFVEIWQFETNSLVALLGSFL